MVTSGSRPFSPLQRMAFTIFAAACLAAYAYPMLQATINQVCGRNVVRDDRQGRERRA